MTREELNNLITKKDERQKILLIRKRALQDLDSELSRAKLGRSVRTFYYYLKRFLSLAFGILFLALAIILLYKPGIIFLDKEVESALVTQYKEEYYNLAGRTVTESLSRIVTDGSENTIQRFITELDRSIEIKSKEDILFIVKNISFLIIFIAFVLFYVARLTGKLRLRNSMISKADALTQRLITDYKYTIEEEAKELEMLRTYLKEESIQIK